MKMYVYDLQELDVLAVIDGDSVSDCRAVADGHFDSNVYGQSFDDDNLHYGCHLHELSLPKVGDRVYPSCYQSMWPGVVWEVVETLYDLNTYKVLVKNLSTGWAGWVRLSGLDYRIA